MVIIFMGIFLLILASVTGFALEEGKYGRALIGREQALDVAESGLEYYRWFLAHFPGNLTNGTGGSGPYSYTVSDPETGGSIGTASIAITGNLQCGQIQSIDITSTGNSTNYPGFPRTLFARYMQQSVAAYAYLLNSNVWAGSTLSITGPYFSNGGIRMDATNNSTVQSAVSTWVCSTSYGCSPAQNSAPGVVGSGSGSSLWQYPASSIDFNGITSNLSSIKTYAMNNGGLYFPKASGVANQRGYHLIFRSNGTVDVYRVTSTVGVPAYPVSGTGVAQTDYNIINAQTYLGNYTIPTNCSVIFVEDRAWVEGTVAGKVTVAAADFVDSNYSPDVYIANNIYYGAYDGSVGLTVIGEGNVLIPLNSPNNLEIHGIFVADGGSFGRDFYTNNSSLGTPVPSSYNADVMENDLLIDGTIVSNGRTGTAWLCGSPGTFCSGYQNRTTSYDELQALNPPPFTPAASDNFGFIEWKEIN